MTGFMRRFNASQLALLCLLAGSAGTAHAQTLAVGVRAGSLGLGPEAVLGLGSRLALRAGIGAVPITPTGTISDISYEIEPPSPLASAGVDLYLLSHLRLMTGLLFGAERTEFTGQLAESVRIGDQTYTPDQVGSLDGALLTRSVAPFVGLGFGGYANSRVGVTLDLGVAFLGENDLELTATGPFTDDPTFQQELEKERLSTEQKLRLRIPAQAVHRFRCIPSTDSGASRPSIPEHSVHRFRPRRPAIPADSVHLDGRGPGARDDAG